MPGGRYSRFGGDKVSRYWGTAGAREGSERREGCHGAILDLLLGKLRALAFGFQLYRGFLCEWYPPTHIGAQCHFSFSNNQLPVGFYCLQLHFLFYFYF